LTGMFISEFCSNWWSHWSMAKNRFTAHWLQYPS